MWTNSYAGRAKKVNPQILCGADLCGAGQPALPPLLTNGPTDHALISHRLRIYGILMLFL